MVRYRLAAAVAALTVAATLAGCTPPLAVTTTSVPDATVNTLYSTTLAASNGTTPYSWTVSAGTLPAGLSLSSSGALSGTPTTVGSVSFTVQVRDASNKTATKALSLRVFGTTADWPQHDGDAGGQAWSPNEQSLTPANVGALAEEWSVRTSCCSNPAVLQGTLYSAGTLPDDPAADGIRAHALADGSLQWTAPLDSTCGPSSVLVDAGAVYVLCASSVRAYARTGSHALLWDTAETDPGQSITYGSLAGTTLLVWSTNGGPTLAYRTSDGQRLWQALPAGGASVRDVAVGGTTAVIAEDARLRAVSLSTGAPLWSRTDVTASSLVVAGGWVYTDDDAGAKRYALSTGAPGWAVRSGGNIYEVVAADADTVYVWEAVFDFGPPSPSRIHALRASDGVTRWSADVPSRVSDVAVTGDLVWVTSSDIFSQGRASDLLALRRSTGVQVDRTSWNDNMYSRRGLRRGQGRGHPGRELRRTDAATDPGPRPGSARALGRLGRRRPGAGGHCLPLRPDRGRGACALHLVDHRWLPARRSDPVERRCGDRDADCGRDQQGHGVASGRRRSHGLPHDRPPGGAGGRPIGLAGAGAGWIRTGVEPGRDHRRSRRRCPARLQVADGPAAVDDDVGRVPPASRGRVAALRRVGRREASRL